MLQLLELGLANALAATLLAIIAALVGRYYFKPPLVYALWVLVLVKLVTPPLFFVSLPRPESLSSEAPATVERAATLTRYPTSAPDSNLPAPSLESISSHAAHEHTRHSQATLHSHLPADAVVAATSTVRAAMDWPACIVGLWCGGACLVFGIAVIRSLRFHACLRQSNAAPAALCSQAQQQARRLGLRRCPQLRMTAGHVSPLAWCPLPFARPVIVFPQRLLEELDKDETAALLVHELAHFRRHDHWLRWLEQVTVILFWWHPVVWWAIREIQRAGDQCCDAWVLWAFPDRTRDYASALLKTITFLAEQRPALPPMASAVGHIHHLERRMKMILRQQLAKELSWPTRIAVVCLAIAVLPVSSRLVAQDPAATEREATNESPPPSEAPAPSDEDQADSKPIEIPAEGILEITMTMNGETTTTDNVNRALYQLRAAARRSDADDSFAVVIQVNGTSRTFTDAQEALHACQVVKRVLEAAKEAQIELGELGRIEAEKPSYASGNPSRSARGGVGGAVGRRSRDGVDGRGVRGGLGGVGASGAAGAQGSPGAASGGAPGAPGVPGGIGGQGGGAGGGAPGLPGQAGGAGAPGAAGGVGGRGGGAGGGTPGLPGAVGQSGSDRRAQAIGLLRHMLVQVLVVDQEPRVDPADSSLAYDNELGAATLFARAIHGDYEKATFSFEFGLRDDPDNVAGNDWDLQYGNGENAFHVTMVTDDLSRMVDLGEMTWQQLSPSHLRELPPHHRPHRELIPTVAGHIYLVHTKDRNSDLYAVFRVEKVTEQGVCDITWKRIPAPGQ